MHVYIYTGHTQKNGACWTCWKADTAPFFCVCPVYMEWARSPCARDQERCCTLLEVGSPMHKTLQVVRLPLSHVVGGSLPTYCNRMYCPFTVTSTVIYVLLPKTNSMTQSHSWVADSFLCNQGIYGTHNFIALCKIAHHLTPSCAKLTHSTPSYPNLFKIHFNSMISSTSRFSKLSLYFILPNQNLPSCPCVPHIIPILFLLISSFKLYLALCTNYETSQ
jgi:hypothetical protein